MAVRTEGLLQRIYDWAGAVHDEAAGQMVEALDANIPRKTGATAESRQLSYSSGGTTFVATVIYPEQLAVWLDEGTAPHLIEGNPLLAFEWNGALVIVHSVNHPGTPATNFWSDVMTDSRWLDELDAAAARVTF